MSIRRYCTIRALELPGPEGAFVHFETTKALAQQELLMPPKLEGREADTCRLPGPGEVGNRLAGKAPLSISWKQIYSLGTCGFLQIFII